MIRTLTGNNQFLIRQKLDKLVSEFVKKHGELGVERIDCEEADFERVNEALTNLPFLAKKKLIILRNPSRIAKFRENIEQIISTIPDSNEAIILETKPDKRLAYFKTLKSKTELFELNELDENELVSWLVKQAKENEVIIGKADASYLVERVGLNQQLLSNELGKLFNYQPKITKETINLLVEPSPRSTIFHLLDAAFTGNKSKVMKIYEEQRKQKVEPLEIMAMIAWQLKNLALIKIAGQRSQTDIAKEAKLNPFVVRKSSEIASHISVSNLKRLIEDASELDVRLKNESIDGDEALKHFLLTLGA